MIRKISSFNLSFEDVTLEFFNMFVGKMYEAGLSKNYLNKIVVDFKTYMSEAEERGFHTNQIYKSKKFRVGSYSGDHITLDIDELNHIHNFKYQRHIRECVDIFIFQAYTSLSFKDALSVTESNISNIEGNKIIEIKRGKSETPSAAPLHPVALAIIEKHHYSLPRKNLLQVNRFIKRACKLAALTETVGLYKHKGGKLVLVKKPKWLWVTTHTARRSFITNAKKMGLSLEDTSRMVGHKNLQTTMRYWKETAKEVALSLSDHPFFND